MKTDYKKNNTGELLTNYLKNNAMQSTRLAELLGITPQTITKYKERTSLRTDRIEAISYALKHNFFQDLANHLPREFTVNADLNSAKSLCSIIITTSSFWRKGIRCQRHMCMSSRAGSARRRVNRLPIFHRDPITIFQPWNRSGASRH